MDFRTMGMMISALPPMVDEETEAISIENNAAYGKDICCRLKKIRDEVAKEHGVDYKSEECTFMDACNSPCARCEEEAQILYKKIFVEGGATNE